MKKIILMLLCIVSMQASAQRYKTIKKGDYIKSSFIEQFVGTWEWKSGNDNLTIKFKKVKYHYKIMEIDRDILFGWLKYVKDGKVIENSIPNMGKDSSYTIVASEAERGLLGVTFTDMNTKKTKTVVMELMPGDKRKAIWRIDPAYPLGITHENNGIPTGDRWMMEKIE